jgi:hypothetical protein
LVTTKDPEGKLRSFEKCIEVIKSAGVSALSSDTAVVLLPGTNVVAHMKNKVGVLPKDTAAGPFAEDWKRTFATSSGEIEEVDISPALSAAFAVKDTDELVRWKRA